MANVLNAAKTFATATLNSGTGIASAVSHGVMTLDAYAADYHQQTVEALESDRQLRVATRIAERGTAIDERLRDAARDRIKLAKELNSDPELAKEFAKLKSQYRSEISAIAAE